MKSIALLSLASALQVPSLHSETIAQWKFEDSPGFLVDETGDHNLSPGVGTVSQVPFTLPGSEAASFNGASNLTTPDSPDWTDDTFTVEAIFTPGNDHAGVTGVIAGHINSGANERSWFLGTRDGRLRLFIASSTTGGPSYDRFTLTAGTPYFAAASVDLGSAAPRAVLYLENLDTGESFRAEIDSDTSIPIPTSILDASANFTIGATDTPSGYFTGLVDEIRVSSEALAGAALLYPQMDPAPPRILDIVATLPDTVSITFESVPGNEYQLRSSQTLGNFQPAGTLVAEGETSVFLLEGLPLFAKEFFIIEDLDPAP